jgi:Uma2 family endonuclease
MALPVPLHAYTYEEYLALEEHARVRHEYVRGEIYAMAGGTPEHAALAAATLRIVGNQLHAGCRTYSADLRVRAEANDVTSYPDGTVVCGKVERSTKDPLAIVNPVLLIEVTSPSTVTYDRGEKLAQYKSIPALREVLLVSHEEARLAVHRREADGTWSTHVSSRGETLHLTSVGASLDVGALYDAASEG